MEADAESIQVSLNLQGIPIAPVTSSDDFIDDVAEGDDDRASFYLIAQPDANAGTYKIPVTITYLMNNKSETQTTFISVSVNAKPSLILTSESNLIQGQKNALDIKITNTGLAGAKFLTVAIENSADYDILSAGSVYIGDLNSDDSDTASFSVYTKSSNSIIVPVTLTYRDSTNQEYSESSTVLVKAYSREEAVKLGLITKSNALTYFIIVVVLVAAYLLYRSIRKRRKKNSLAAR
jgi:hypothetical protein